MSRVFVQESQPWENDNDYANVATNGGEKIIKKVRGLTEDGSGRICTQHSEAVENLVAG